MTRSGADGPSKLVRRLPLLALALVSLIAGLWSGLLRLGIDLPPLRSDLASLHGPVMVLGFLGAQIGLERAVALGRGWTYLVPAAAGAGSLWLIAGLPAEVGQALLAAGGLLLVAVSIEIHRIQPAWHNVVMGAGAVCWAVGALAWLLGAALVDAVPWLAAFLILTIVGERLELSRMVQPPEAALRAMQLAVAVFIGGLVASAWLPAAGLRVAGLGLLAQTIWLLRFDVARRTVRMTGAARYMAVALLSGYAWLAFASVALIGAGELAGYGYEYDAVLHAIFVGFVFSMIFAHAPVIVPALLGIALPYRPVLFLPLALLHAGLVLRVAGGAVDNADLWRAGGVISELAIVMYIALSAINAIRANRQKSRKLRVFPAP